jgi:uncharacterized Zn finger protein
VTRRKAVAATLRAGAASQLGDGALRALAGERRLERGRDYFADGRVELERDQGSKASFVAHGSDDYRVALALSSRGLDADCQCPHADDGFFCKHMVAAAMLRRRHLGSEEAVLEGARPGPRVLPPAHRLSSGA